MALVSVNNVSMAFGGPPVLERINMHISSGERVCVLGRNGAGKSTLLRLLKGDTVPDDGEIVIRHGVRTALLPQDVPENLKGTIFEIVRAGMDSHQWPQPDSDHGGEWQQDLEASQIISRMELDPDAAFETLSAGMKRRVLLAKALVCVPDILLLDEPTNHLDIDAITWMETFLVRFGGTLFFVTHDRMFMRKLATRVVEIERGALIDWSCGYDAFLTRKDAALEKEKRQWERFDEKLAREESWIRQGIKARRTRNEGRVRTLEGMRDVRRARRQREGMARIATQEAERTGKLVIEAKDISFSYNGPPMISNFSTTIIRGDKVGIMGPNGSGKTTLLRLLLGDLTPATGTVRHGTRIEVGYFDQLRAQLDEHKSVQDNVSEGNDTILFNGRPRHIISYLQDFLFTRERARSPVSQLSGGERNRLMLARLFTTPANVLVLDEPTNDLDVETLELLEELLLEFSGTLLLVSHDREFLNNVVTSTLVCEGHGTVTEYVGGYDDWLRQRQPESTPLTDAAQPARQKVRPKREKPRTLTYKEQRELETLPQEIESLETAQRHLYDLMTDPAFYKQDSSTIVKVKDKLNALESEIARTYQRWEFLERLQEETQQRP